MPQPVFLSYSRSASGAAAQALHDALGDDQAFLDTSDIEAGEQFPSAFTEALLGSRVAVVFASAPYFQSWYCLRELRTALAPYEALLRKSGATREELDQALRHIVAVLPNTGSPQLEKLPPALAMANAIAATDTRALAEFVMRRLEAVNVSIRAGLVGAEASRILEGLVDEAAMPPPANLQGVRVYHRHGSLDLSLGPRFVGRANDLWKIHFELCTMRGDPAKSSTANVRLHSLGGCGKTRIALEYALRYGPRYFTGGLFWLEANVDKAGLEEQFHGILRILKPDVPDLDALRKDGKLVETLLRDELARHTEPALFVVDDIPESRPGENPRRLTEFCPALGLVSVLATSRQSVREPGVVEISLDYLPPTPSVRLLRDGLDGSEGLSENDWGDLAGAMGGLPLVLDLANKLLASGAYPAGKLLERILTAPLTPTMDNARRALQGQVADTALKGITEVFLASFEKLDEATQLVACLLAYFAPVAIPEAIMASLPEEANTAAIRAALRLRHFLTGQGAAAFGVMHRVLADFLKTQLQPHQPLFLLGACRAASGAMTIEHCQDPKEWPVMNLCRTHAEHLFGLVARDGGAEELLRRAIYIGGMSGMLLFYQGDLTSAEEVQRRVFEACQRLLGNWHADTLTGMGRLGFTLAQKGDLEGAHKLQAAALEKQWNMLGPDHEDTLEPMSNFAWTLSQEGNYALARELQEHVLRRLSELHGPEDPNTVAALSNLSDTVFAQKDLARARVLQEEVVRLMKQIYGDESFNALTAMCALGKTLRGLQQIAEALEILNTAERIAARRFGDEHPITLLARTNLGAVLFDSGDARQARIVQEKVLEVRRRRYGTHNPETVIAMSNLGNTLFRLGEYQLARSLQEDVVQIRTEPPGQYHPYTCSSLLDLGLTLFAQNERQRACEVYRRAYQASKRGYGIAHPHVAENGATLVTALQLTGEAQAAAVVERELHLFTEFGRVASGVPTEVVSVLSTEQRIEELNGQARARRNSGDPAGAMEAIAVALQHALARPETAFLGTVLITLGTIHLAGKRYQPAYDAFEGASLVFHDLEQGESEWTAYMWMGRTSEEAGEIDRAIVAYERAYLSARAEPHGEDVKTILQRLALLYGKAGKPHRQWECEQELLASERTRGGK